MTGASVEYEVVIHPGEEGGYWAEVPALEGCFAQRETIEELLEEARGAIVSHLEALREDGHPIPADQGIIVATVRLPESSAAQQVGGSSARAGGVRPTAQSSTSERK